MTKISDNKSTYGHFLKVWTEFLEETQIIDYETILSEYSLDKNLYNNTSSVVYILDLAKMKYIFMSKNILDYTGYSADEFITKGPFFTLSLVHPEDKTTLIEKVHNTQAAFIRSLTDESYKDYRFSYTYRLKRADGIYVQVLKQDMVLEADTNGNPLLLIGIASDISFMKKDTQVYLAISKVSKGFSENLHIEYSQKEIISARELEVLTLITEGKSTEQIAQSLAISPNTVKNHRRHMLEKTGASNMAEVIRLAYANGWI